MKNGSPYMKVRRELSEALERTERVVAAMRALQAEVAETRMAVSELEAIIAQWKNRPWWRRFLGLRAKV